MSDPLKLLVIDDEAGIVDYVKKLFSRRGYQTFGAVEGGDAVRLFQEQKPDICLIDVLLSESSCDGIEVLEKIKQVDPEAVCIMVTRVTDTDKVERARALGALHYIMKPLDAKELEQIVEEAKELLEQRRTSG